MILFVHREKHLIVLYCCFALKVSLMSAENTKKHRMQIIEPWCQRGGNVLLHWLYSFFSVIHTLQENTSNESKWTKKKKLHIRNRYKNRWDVIMTGNIFRIDQVFLFFFVLFFGCLSLCERALVAQNAINQSEYLSGLPFSRAFALSF